MNTSLPAISVCEPGIDEKQLWYNQNQEQEPPKAIWIEKIVLPRKMIVLGLQELTPNGTKRKCAQTR